MEKVKVSDTKLSLMVKLALEYNASILALTAVYYGNVKDKKSQQRFHGELKVITDDYRAKLQALFAPPKAETEVS